MTEGHISVLYAEVLAGLEVKPNGRYIDATLGAGGHTRGILEAGGEVLAFDWDAEAITFAQAQLAEFGAKVRYVNASYGSLGLKAPEQGYRKVDGIVMDLGLSSRQLDDPDRGFSFRYTAPLDMRFDQRQTRTAADLVNSLSAEALADIFYRYGDERQSRKIARAIVAQRPLHTTTQLAELVARTLNPRGRPSRIHPATRVFQALRIAVNDELGELEKGLQAGIALLKPGGRIAVISFHSLEDRLVKQTFRELSAMRQFPPEQLIVEWDPIVKLVTRKPIVPTEEEIARNPRSRSAKLRIAEKLRDEHLAE